MHMVCFEILDGLEIMIVFFFAFFVHNAEASRRRVVELRAHTLNSISIPLQFILYAIINHYYMLLAVILVTLRNLVLGCVRSIYRGCHTAKILDIAKKYSVLPSTILLFWLSPLSRYETGPLPSTRDTLP
jgi:hypothetical protein